MTDHTLRNFIKELEKKKLTSHRKFPAISEIIDDKQYQLKVKGIYTLSAPHDHIYLFIIRNYNKNPKKRYFLCSSLASVSSDLLVLVAKDFALQHDIKLIQYSLNPNLLRLNLLALKEITIPKDFSQILSLLREYKSIFKIRLRKINDLTQL
ncbi:MAG: hypothetical protein BAJALOKI1v1_130040 [Promethearchaeota archaeon]|nr:MAG: hypothetical protein BAJALOKI1v1_130040 [Candidatus Lokiarchaeota archaeon]